MTSVFAPMTLAETRSFLTEHGAAALHELVAGRAAKSALNAITATGGSGQGLDGPLKNIPFGVKDNIDDADYPTTGASPALKNNRSGRDASVVATLKAAGGYVPFKLNMHELAFGITSNNAAYGPVRNPFDPTRVAGGSSGGSAAAVAAGIIPFALGTDTGGSTRIPAAFCGIAGFRPSTGRCPSDGVLTLSSTRDTIGPMAVNCGDLAEIDGVITGDQSLPDVAARPLRLGVMWDRQGLSAAVDDGVAAVLKRLERDGIVTLQRIDPEPFQNLEERMGNALVFNEALQFWQTFCVETLGLTWREFAAELASPDVRHIFDALPDLAAETTDAFEIARKTGVQSLRQQHASVLTNREIDAIVTPTVLVQPPKIGKDAEIDTEKGSRATFPCVTHNTSLATLAGIPSVAIPIGLDRDGLPLSLMLEGPRHADRWTLAAAIRIEAALFS